MSTVERSQRALAAGPVVRVVAATGATALGVSLWLRWDEARRTADDAYLTSDLVALSALAAVGLVVVGLLVVWGVRGGGRRTHHLVIGMAATAVLTLPVLWYSAVPVMVATAVIALGARIDGRGGVRWSRLAALLVIAAVVATWAGSTVAGHL